MNIIKQYTHEILPHQIHSASAEDFSFSLVVPKEINFLISSKYILGHIFFTLARNEYNYFYNIG